jgi:hypothetical protein
MIGARLLIAGGTALIGFGLLVLSAADSGGSLWLAETGLVLTGCGMGLNTGPLFGVAVASASATRSGSASSLINVARMIGATLGVAVLGSAFALAGSLWLPMLLGGVMQLTGGFVAWWAIR